MSTAHGGKGGGALRVVVTGASGNVGTSVVNALLAGSRPASVVGVARRLPDPPPAGTDWVSVDIGRQDATRELTGVLEGADAVVHLAWLLQPSHDPAVTWRTNVLGTDRVLRAAAAAEVPAVVYASSVAAYSPRPVGRDRFWVDESWPTHGWPTAAYSREKAYVERLLDVFERDHPGVRVVRMRPCFIFKRGSAMAQRRLFAGPLLPNRLVRPSLVPVVPDVPGLRFQAVHSDDVGRAYASAVTGEARGAFNLAADTLLDGRELGRLLGARPVPVPRLPVRQALAAAWRLRLVPASPTLFDALMRLPLLETGRARRELGWEPALSGPQAVAELLRGMREGAGMDTPPLAAHLRGGRLRELVTGVGGRP
ncbi:NAD-dependent epimerase/dehydratase family protein [Streptomyces sp. OF3]|uniref:NAD-dependent epimerase/dehydratase family protein n=1 Tax=Streptomyces alkaliterrae TaxID=2213162 RepID=A0A7W3ZM12_9ACTN|nr:NAD-dependent epimerase/dehydratase family protein [Streptomyces alkaliterrae]MBB1253273.1 NAD-dependent epimerase/dehydratase family protein [Streptomyces alkaliterrae]